MNPGLVLFRVHKNAVALFGFQVGLAMARQASFVLLDRLRFITLRRRIRRRQHANENDQQRC